MPGELGSIVILDASLALDHNFGTFSLDVLKQLGSRHMLEVFMVTDIAPKLRTLIHRMLL